MLVKGDTVRELPHRFVHVIGRNNQGRHYVTYVSTNNGPGASFTNRV